MTQCSDIGQGLDARIRELDFFTTLRVSVRVFSIAIDANCGARTAI